MVAKRIESFNNSDMSQVGVVLISVEGDHEHWSFLKL